MNKKFHWSITLALCLTAFGTIAVLSDLVFEHVPHSEDEVAYLFQAKVFAQNRLAVPTPTNSQAFWTPFVVDYNGHRFGKYPPGWPLLLSLGIRLQSPWVINALLGSLSLALIAWLGRCFYGSWIGPVTAGLGLVTPAFLFLSSSLLSHPASLFWNTAALGAFFYAVQHPQSSWRLSFAGRQQLIQSGQVWGLITGLALGAAFLTRPFAAIGVGLAIALFGLILVLKGDSKWPVLLWLTLGTVVVSTLLPLYWWAITGNFRFNAYLLVWPYDRPGFGPDIGPYGYGLSEAIFINTRLKLTTLATGLFGWPGWSNLLFLPLPFLAGRANRWDWLLLGILASLIGVHIFYWAFGGTDGGFPRYYYAALPALLLLTARGIQVSVDFLSHLSPVKGEKINLGWLPVGLVLAFIAFSLLWRLPPLLAAQQGKYEITPAPLQAVNQAGPPEPALILVKNVDSWHDFAAPFAANSPTLDGPVVYAIDWGEPHTHQLRLQFKDRTCWELHQEKLTPCE